MMRPVVNEVRDEQALIRKMEVEIAELRRKLVRMAGRGAWLEVLVNAL